MPLLATASKYWNSKTSQEFDRHLNWYNTGHKSHYKTFLTSLSSYIDAMPSNTDSIIDTNHTYQIKSEYIQQFIKIFDELDEHDAKSVDEISNLHTGFLQNIPKDTILYHSQQYVRENVCQILDSIQKHSIDNINSNYKPEIRILSHNWSDDMIYHAIDRIIPLDHIYSNTLEFDENTKLTTGHIIQVYIDIVYVY